MAFTTFTGTITAGAGSKGAYVQATPSTPYNSSRFYLNIGASSVPFRSILVDIATGIAGSEVVVLANLAFTADSEGIVGIFIPINLDISTGTRIALRAQAVAGLTLSFSIYLETRAIASLISPNTYGTVLANVRGTEIDPGATINTKSAYVQLTASTSARIDSLLVCATISLTTALNFFYEWLVDIAIGTSGAETIVIADLHYVAGTLTDALKPNVIYVPISIPTGTRITARCSCTRNTATERLMCISVIGMQEPSATIGSTSSSVAYVG